MPQPSDKLSHKRRKFRLLLLDQLLETPTDPIPVKDIEMTTAIGRTITTTTRTTCATTTTTAITTMDEVRTIAEGTIIIAATTIAATTTTVAMRSTIGRMIIVVTIIATTITPTNDTQEITKGTTGRKMSARSDGVHPTTTEEGHAPQGLNHHFIKSIKNENWYR